MRSQQRLVQAGVLAALVVALVVVLVLDDRGAGSQREALQREAASRSASPSPSASASPTAPASTGAGTLSAATGPANVDLTRCTPGARPVATCGKAPAFRGITTWLNTAGGVAIPQDDLAGHVVLVEFFSYACAACVRDEPYLTAWDDTYRPFGLRVVAVHSPTFGFERDPQNVFAALGVQDVRYPVALDPSNRTARRYRASARPARYLIDQAGVVRAISLNGGAYGVTENQLRSLLLEGQRPGTRLPEPASPNVITDDVATGEAVTPDTRLGAAATGYAGIPDLAPGRVVYEREADQPLDSFSLGGAWQVRPKAFIADEEASVRLKVHAQRAWVVVSGRGTITVHRDGEADSVIPVVFPGAYKVLDAGQVVTRRLDVDVTPGLTLHELQFR